jgi:soluble lytic murein transglycosylase-like protein
MVRSVLLSLFRPFARRFPILANIASVSAHSCGRGRPLGERAQRTSRDGGAHGRKLLVAGSGRKMSRILHASVSTMLVAPLLVAIMDLTPSPARALGVEHVRHRAAVDEAAARFNLPTLWIEAVIAAESGGEARAVSAKGAMGLMQLMPATWRELRAHLGLGADPFSVRDNVMAGSFYLRQLHDRFGLEGALSAYNAGPHRYAQHLASGRPLPSETRAYVASIKRRLSVSRPVASLPSWREAPLFPSSSATLAPDFGAAR